MPAGLGYGAIGKATSSLLRAAGGPGRTAIGGAVIGGGYGAVDDDTSILGGALAGATMGAGAYGLARGGLTFARATGRASRGFFTQGAGRSGAAMWNQAASPMEAATFGLGAVGRQSSRYFGSMFNKAMNPIKSTLKANAEAGGIVSRMDWLNNSPFVMS